MFIRIYVPKMYCQMEEQMNFEILKMHWNEYEATNLVHLTIPISTRCWMSMTWIWTGWRCLWLIFIYLNWCVQYRLKPMMQSDCWSIDVLWCVMCDCKWKKNEKWMNKKSNVCPDASWWMFAKLLTYLDHIPHHVDHWRDHFRLRKKCNMLNRNAFKILDFKYSIQ